MIICLAADVVLLAAFVVAESRVAHPMFDLSLLRVPTFTGGSIAAFAMNGSLYAMLLYFVLYLQDVLGYSALDAGLRIAIISAAKLVTAVIAGRLSERVPARWLIGPGLLLVGIGLILMAGLSGASVLDPPDPRVHRRRARRRPGQPAARLDRDRRRPAGQGRHGLRGQHDLPASRHRRPASPRSARSSRRQSQHHLTSVLPPPLAGSARTFVNVVRQGSIGQLLGKLPPADRGLPPRRCGRVSLRA